MMMTNGIAIRVSDLSKKFNIYRKPSDIFWELFERKPRHREFWALRNITFDVKEGEVVGVIGRNGSGKTTMLRIISSTLEKTSGTVEINGRVSAIMALGTGFNLELNGRENILIGGLCLGMTKDEIMAKMDSIVEFSGLESFMDQPCRTYSSGMLARLAFSTAISVQPDIFIIDEALSVGDMAFAAKCFTRIRKIAASGATVFFVSHDLESVYSLCDRALLLEKGQLIAMGEPRKVGTVYEQIVHNEMAAENKKPMPYYSDIELTPPEDMYADIGKTGDHPGSQVEDSLDGREAGQGGTDDRKTTIQQNEPAQELKAADGSREKLARILEAYVVDSLGKRVPVLRQGQSYIIRIRSYCAKGFESLSIGFRLQTPSGTAVYGTSSSLHNKKISARAGDVICIDFSFHCNLSVGPYFLNAGIAEMLGGFSEYYHYTMLHFLSDAATIQVSGPNKFAGIVNLNSEVINAYKERPGGTGKHGKQQAEPGTT